jgi:ribosomal protein L22
MTDETKKPAEEEPTASAPDESAADSEQSEDTPGEQVSEPLSDDDLSPEQPAAPDPDPSEGVTESERADDTPGEQVSPPEPEEVDAPATSEPGASAATTAKPPRRRRGAAEVGTATRRDERRSARRDPAEAVEVRAQARYVRTAPRKARLVIDHIRGKTVDEAIALLTHTPRGAAEDVLKLLRSCVANADNNHGLDADELKIGRAYVDEGPTLKRYRPRAQGRATRIRKRTSHMTITLVPKE